MDRRPQHKHDAALDADMTARCCPQCRSTKIRLSPSRSIIDRGLNLLTIYFFRCQLCAHRFPAWLRRKVPPARRSYERLPVLYPVWFRPASAAEESRSEEGLLLNLTIRGCRIRAQTDVPLGTCLTLEFQPSPYGLPITVDGAVVRSRQSNIIGLRFVKLSRCEERRIGRVIDLYLQDTQHELIPA